MGKYTKGNGFKIWHTDTDNTRTRWECNTWDNGCMISKMGMDAKYPIMVQNIKGNSKMGESMERVSLPGKTAPISKDNLKRIEYKDLGNTFGMIGEYILEIGNKIKWTEKEFLYGLMAVNTKGNIKTTKKKDLESFIGLTEVNIKDIGLKASNTVKESITKIIK